MEQANEVTEWWVVDYNYIRPHKSLNHQPPIAYAA
ncbi:MAG: integrase core domain-containing protein [Dolichospermum sp.]